MMLSAFWAALSAERPASKIDMASPPCFQERTDHHAASLAQRAIALAGTHTRHAGEQARQKATRIPQQGRVLLAKLLGLADLLRQASTSPEQFVALRFVQRLGYGP